MMHFFDFLHLQGEFSFRYLEILVIVIGIDTAIGILVGIKNHSLKSSVGRTGLLSKLAEILAVVGFQLASLIDAEHFPSSIANILYLTFAFFEATSIIENLYKLGLINEDIVKALRVQVPEPTTARDAEKIGATVLSEVSKVQAKTPVTSPASSADNNATYNQTTAGYDNDASSQPGNQADNRRDASNVASDNDTAIIDSSTTSQADSSNSAHG